MQKTRITNDKKLGEDWVKMSTLHIVSRYTLLITILSLMASPAVFAHAQIGSFIKSDKDLKLAPDSPFRDPNTIYLEADEVERFHDTGIIIAQGQVEGRYQDKTLRADKVTYSTRTGMVVAEGNVVLINADGSSQYAEKFQLSDKLEAGNASNFTSKFPSGGQLGSAFVTRETEEGIELYNAYYTACKVCKNPDGTATKPTWRLKARKAKQNRNNNSISYRDAVFEFKGVPVFYMPFLAHPDPTAKRQSGWLVPFGGHSGNKGLSFRAPYYFAIDRYSELTLTPRVFSRVNPLLQAKFRRKFYSGEFTLEATGTYSRFFDNNGNDFLPTDFFVNPGESLRSRKWRSSIHSTGLFNLGEQWKWGFEIGYATDDNYINRYDLLESYQAFGLYRADSRRLMEQIFVVGQGDDFRFSTTAFGQISLRSSVRRTLNNPSQIIVTRENDRTLPFAAPKIELAKYFKDPVFNGRLKLFGDTTFLFRGIGTDYTRATAGLEWNRTFIAPGGVEMKPFAQGRFDFFNLTPEGESGFDFSRGLGQIGTDIRWPFVNPGGNITWIVEPRIQITHTFGDPKLENFTFTEMLGNRINLVQDGTDIDLDQALLWSPNKSTGFDIWEEGTRIDVGGSLIADWGKNNRAHLFVGQSFYEGNANPFARGSGLGQDSSDLVGLFKLQLGDHVSYQTRVRYDGAQDKFRRLDTRLKYEDSRFNANVRYYKFDSTFANQLGNSNAPPEEVSGSLTTRLFDYWKVRYKISHDIDRNLTRRQQFGLIYDDQCTQIELLYNTNKNNLGIIGQSDGFSIRFSLLSLGAFRGG